MAGKGRGKRSRDQISKESSGVSPPVKKASVAIRRKRNTVQTSISEWIRDDDVTHSQRMTTNGATPNTTSQQQTPPSPTLSDLPPGSQQDSMLSPILSQPMGSTERSSSAIVSDENSPISSALNLAASAASLRRDFAMCEKVMTEKHQFLVAMLDSMSSTVSGIAEKLDSLASRVTALEKKDDMQSHTARAIYEAANSRQNQLEKKTQDNLALIKSLQSRCGTVEDLTGRVEMIEKQLPRSKDAPQATSVENLDIAIYGLQTYDDVMTSVNHMFKDMNLRHVQCTFAFRTPTRPGTDRYGIVIAGLNSLHDKRMILERKRFLRQMPQYGDVFIKSSKTHAEQVMHANFTMMLNEMENGGSYYISDNGRIRQKAQNRYSDTNGYRYNVDYSRSRSRHQHAHGGARPKTSLDHSQNYQSTEHNGYRYATEHNTSRNQPHHANQANRRTDDVRNNTSYADVLKKSDDYRQIDTTRKQTRYEDAEMRAERYSHDDAKRTPIESHHYDLYSAQQYDDHTNYSTGTHTKQYNNRFIHSQNTVGHIKPKN